MYSSAPTRIAHPTQALPPQHANPPAIPHPACFFLTPSFSGSVCSRRLRPIGRRCRAQRRRMPRLTTRIFERLPRTLYLSEGVQGASRGYPCACCAGGVLARRAYGFEVNASTLVIISVGACDGRWPGRPSYAVGNLVRVRWRCDDRLTKDKKKQEGESRMFA